MFRNILLVPVCAIGLLGMTQFASAQSMQPSKPCPDKTAQNYNRGTEAGNSGQVAQNYNRGTEAGNNGQVAQNFNRGTTAQVAGRAVDPSSGCM